MPAICFLSLLEFTMILNSLGSRSAHGHPRPPQPLETCPETSQRLPEIFERPPMVHMLVGKVRVEWLGVFDSTVGDPKDIHHPGGAKRPRGGVYTNCCILQQFAYTPPNRPHQPFPYFSKPQPSGGVYLWGPNESQVAWRL